MTWLCYVLAFFILLTVVVGSAYSTVREDDVVRQEETLPKEKEIVADETDLKDLDTYWLSEITHYSRKENVIDISLDRQPFNEVCYIQPPNKTTFEASVLQMEKVTVQHKSDYVSCRITIGPIDDNLIGKWKLCGKSEDNGEMRCQLVTITWNNNNNSTGNWLSSNETSFAHPIHIGGSVNSGVSSSGNVFTCHVVTPAGEDLVITTAVKYPHIERSSIDNPSLCSVLIKNITLDMLGSWLIYGRFRSVLGQNEVRLPLTFNLFNEEQPYDQAYNISVLETQKHLVNMATNLSVEVSQRTGTVESCMYMSPSGKKFIINDHNTDVPEGVIISNFNTACQINISAINEETIGEWHIIGRFQNGVLFDERRLTFHIIQEDAANPIQESIERVIENIAEQNIITDMNRSHTIAISSDIFIQHESCHLITPDGLQYAFIPGFNVPNVEILYQSDVECGIVINLKSESMIGEWTLIARATRLSVPIERRLSFTLRVEENFVIQDDIYIKEGQDLYLHLNSYTSVEHSSMPETCILYGPIGTEMINVEVDPMYKATCGYILRNVDRNHNGTWVIEYGYKIKRRGSVNVHVIDYEDLALDNLHWIVGNSIEMSVGPEHAVYCKVSDSFGRTIFDDFGKCKIVLERVTVDHGGYWTVSVGLPGSVRLQQYGFYVDVHNRDSRPLVTTTVERNGYSVMMTCSVPIQHEVHACKFRDPRNNILVAAHGVGHDRYIFNGSIANYDSNAQSHDCTLRISIPLLSDLGIWRCALNTSTGPHYGFLTLLIPEAMKDSEVAAAVIIEPALTPKTSMYLEGEPVSMSCSISSPLRYCYFRARNGTIYNVFPRMSRENFEYIGAGLDAGECGIRFNSFTVREAKGWSCHVGLVNTTAKEQWANVNADVIAKMLVRHYLRRSSLVVVEARVYNEHALDYCRFVRMDGFGFTSDNLPLGYSIDKSLYMGFCILYISNPSIIDLRPWTIAAKLTGVEGEISMTTTDNLFVVQQQNEVGEILFWVLIITLCLIPVMAASALVPKSNRDWTYRRANRLRESFRSSWNNSFARKPFARTQGV